jgi:hypothetical protein
MSDQSFGRNVKLRVFASIIGDTNGVPNISYSNGYTEFSSVQSDGTPGFRIKGKAVQVQPTVGFNTNQIEIEIYNLGPDSRAIIQSMVGTKIALFAGYGLNPKQIALGDILWARTHKEGADYITHIIAGDSHFAYSSGEIHQSFKGQVSYQTVVNAIMGILEQSDLFLATPNNIPDGGYENGIVLNGSPLDELAKVAQRMGLTMSVIGGGVFLIPYGTDVGNPIIEISEDTGMIGIPEVQPPGTIGPQQNTVPVSPENSISFVHLLRSDLALSQRVRIKSKFIQGEYVIGRVVFEFDSWSGPFYNRCEAFKVIKNAG